ncbi:hypothetical protein D3227_33965 [Mesorhizobium waimense]|uniref:Uncharacterized protein n=1 Tax=Mesorhizobium waimense TaxID=1300307 RepID=A0A3A5K6W2_9HYPH|nr:hypothetical protein D3227_33965 [Mesorhizobium waimense]
MSTIGELARSAGIGSSPQERTAFRFRFHRLPRVECRKAGVTLALDYMRTSNGRIRNEYGYRPSGQFRPDYTDGINYGVGGLSVEHDF